MSERESSGLSHILPMTIWLTLSLLLAFFFVRASARPPLRLGLRWQPLIGGPRFFPAHVCVTLTEVVDAALSSRREEIVYLDYVPEDATNPATLVRLLTGRDVPGVVRQRASDGFTSAALASELCEGFDSARLNLFSRNCYHFAWHVYRRYQSR